MDTTIISEVKRARINAFIKDMLAVMRKHNVDEIRATSDRFGYADGIGFDFSYNDSTGYHYFTAECSVINDTDSVDQVYYKIT